MLDFKLVIEYNNSNTATETALDIYVSNGNGNDCINSVISVLWENLNHFYK